MQFPERSREGSEAHRGALRRLDEARGDLHKASEAHEASKQTPREVAAASDLAAAENQFGAREAWTNWVERGY
ncbi:MAG: hypothetical protein QOK04_753 [Solirubrobacteraceae bacterium]|jgi:hypothetical protein|nr:hypothetical protein [Solirubrobacteraceae bacterium]